MDSNYIDYKTLDEYKNINKELKEYLNENIFPVYDGDDLGGHDRDHIEKVISRSFEIAKEFCLDVRFDIVYTIAVYHDVGYRKNPNNHAYESSIILLNDKSLNKYYTQDEVQIMADAIEDHPANLEYEARNVYGKIVSSADRECVVDNLLRRAFLFQEFKHKGENLTDNEIVSLAYNKLLTKYSKNGYAIMYYKDKKYLDFLDEMDEILKDEKIFKERQLKLVRC